MARTAHNSQSSRTSRRLAAALALTGAVVCAGQAVAIPTGGGGLPLNEPPSAALTATPNPVVVPTLLVRDIGSDIVVAQALQLGTPVSFSAQGSADEDGSIVTYEWDIDGVPGFEKTTAGPTTSRRYSTPGNFTARVRVTDDDGATATESLPFIAHRAPAARITGKSVSVVGEGLVFTSASTDDNGIASLEWDMDGDGSFERTGPQQGTSFGTTGPHKVTLRATDTLGAASTTSLTVRVHRAPTALIVTAPPAPIVNQPTVLDGSRSSDDGAIATYEWDLNGDGTFETNTAAVPRATTTFTALGPAKVGLKVTDNDGATDQTTLTLQVVAAPAVATADSIGPRLRPLTKNLRMSAKGRISFRVACPATEQICSAAVQVKGTRGALAGRLLGRARIDMQGGETTTVRVPLSTKAQRVAAKGLLRARVIVATTDALGNLARTRTVVSIRR